MIVVFDGGHAAFRTKIYPNYKKKDKRISGDLNEAITQSLDPIIAMSSDDFESIKKDIKEIQLGTADPEEMEKLLKSFELSKEEIKKIRTDFDYYNREIMKNFTFDILNLLLPAMGIPTLRVNGEEADDVIYVLTKKLIDNYSIYCVTSDEDFVQMAHLGAVVVLYRQDLHITAKNFKDKYKFDLDGFTLYKSIKGDESDKIKGVPGVGKVNATKIVSNLKEPTIEALFDFCSNSTDKKHKAVIDNFKIVKRNMKLMDFRYIEVDEDDIMNSFKKAKKEAVTNFPLVKKLFYELGLQTAGIKWLTELLKTQ
jgi:5'-3' exonuclease